MDTKSTWNSLCEKYRYAPQKTDLRQPMSSGMIHVFGNSHAALFTGAPPSGNVVPKAKEKPRGRGYTERHPTLTFRTWFLGAVLAYNFFEKYLPKVKSHIEEKKEWFPPGTKILLMVGEIDCRLAIPKQAGLEPNRSSESLVEEVIDRFFRAGIELKNMGFEPIFFGMNPTTDPDYWFNPHTPRPGNESHQPDMREDWFKWGTPEERNSFCLIWNKYMKSKCEAHNFPFVSIYEHVVDENNLAKPEFYIDQIHMNHDRCIGFIVEEFKKANIDVRQS